MSDLLIYIMCDDNDDNKCEVYVLILGRANHRAFVFNLTYATVGVVFKIRMLIMIQKILD